MNLKVLAPVIVIGVVIVAFSILFSFNSNNVTDFTPVEYQSGEFSEPIPMMIMETNGVKHSIPLDKIKGGGPPKDGIPSIDDPVFAGVQNSNFMSDSDTVIGLEINGEAKAYPIFILVWHEIVNDKVGDTPVSVTYCPLCYTIRFLNELLMDKK